MQRKKLNYLLVIPSYYEPNEPYFQHIHKSVNAVYQRMASTISDRKLQSFIYFAFELDGGFMFNNLICYRRPQLLCGT